MTNFQLKLLAAALFLPFALGLRPDFTKNIPVKEIHEGDRIDEANGRVEIVDQSGDGFVEYFTCDATKGKVLALSDDRKFAACCLPGQTLLGSPETAFDCCANGHDLVGKKETGYRCCPTGQDYDGTKCVIPSPVCRNGKVLMGGKCVCPRGTTEAADGTCKKEAGCDSGLITGKCYQFKMPDGHLLGYHPSGWYASMTGAEKFRKFKFCTDEACTPGTDVDPGDAVHILDVHGLGIPTSNVKQWLNGAANGAHIGMTQDYSQAGSFSITKWSCGKFCLAGVDNGVRQACPSTEPALTIDTEDKQACLPLDIIEVPCDIRAADNNCFWEKKPGACGPGDVASCQCTGQV